MSVAKAQPEPAIAEAITEPPAIGKAWSSEGGIYAGLIRGEAGQPDYHLVVADEAKDAINWKDASAWAAALTVAGHQDFALPKRNEQAVLFGNVPELFERDWYWSSTQYAGDAGSAWCQSFDDGLQIHGHESNELRARAVRRLIL